MITVYEHMEDFDNAELSDYERNEQLREAVQDYNAVHGTEHNPEKCLIRYKAMQWRKQYEDD